MLGSGKIKRQSVKTGFTDSPSIAVVPPFPASATPLNDKSRPNSAPLQNLVNGSTPNSPSPSIGSGGVGLATSVDQSSLVEQRLRIVKRNRSRSIDDIIAAQLPEATEPPCKSFPCFDRTPIKKSEQQLVDATLHETVDAVLFADMMM